HLGERLPQVAGKPNRVLRIAQLPQMRHRRLVTDETARAVAQHRLFFVEDEGHGRGSGKFESSIDVNCTWRGQNSLFTLMVRRRSCAVSNHEASILRDAAKRPLLRMRSFFKPPADQESVLRRCRA